MYNTYILQRPVVYARTWVINVVMNSLFSVHVLLHVVSHLIICDRM